MPEQPRTDRPTPVTPSRWRRWRLLPLGGVITAVAVLGTVGAVQGTPVSGNVPAAAGTQAAAPTGEQGSAVRTAERARKVCQPRYATRIKREPWRGSTRAASERAYSRAIAKEDPAYVRGKDGWLFFSDLYNDNFSQAVGREVQTAKQQKAWVKYLKKSAATAKAAGADYRVVVMPANWDIHPEKLPSWAVRLRGSTSLVRLMKAHPELPFIDTRAALAKAARKNDTYEPLNSHWTPYGGYVAWQQITKCLAATNPALSAISTPPLKGVGTEANANEFSGNGVPDGKPARTYPIYAAQHPGVTTTHLPDGAAITTAPDFVTDTVQTPLKTVTSGAQAQDLTMLTLRDSTGNALSPLYSWSFGTTVQYAHGIAQADFSPPNLKSLVAAHKPTLVLFVITERFLSETPPKR